MLSKIFFRFCKKFFAQSVEFVRTLLRVQKEIFKNIYNKYTSDNFLKSQSGFSIIEAAIVITVIGILSSGMFGLLSSLHKIKCEQITIEHRKKIEIALGSFLGMHYCLPYASDPENKGEDFGRTNPCTFGKENPCRLCGIVPFRLLGISEEYAKDGYGNFFTYIVAFSFAGGVGTYESIENLEDSYLGQNEIKRGEIADREIEVLYSDGTSVLNQKTIPCKQKYEMINNPQLDHDSEVLQNNVIAFVLISHGPKGVGAFKKGTAPIFDKKNAGRTDDKNIDAIKDYYFVKIALFKSVPKIVLIQKTENQTVFWYCRYSFASEFANLKYKRKHVPNEIKRREENERLIREDNERLIKEDDEKSKQLRANFN